MKHPVHSSRDQGKRSFNINEMFSFIQNFIQRTIQKKIVDRLIWSLSMIKQKKKKKKKFYRKFVMICLWFVKRILNEWQTIYVNNN